MILFVRRAEKYTGRHGIPKREIAAFRYENGQDPLHIRPEGFFPLNSTWSPAVSFSKFERLFPSLSKNEVIQHLYETSFRVVGISGHNKGNAVIFFNPANVEAGEPIPPEVFVSAQAAAHPEDPISMEGSVFAIFRGIAKTPLKTESRLEMLSNVLTLADKNGKGATLNWDFRGEQPLFSFALFRINEVLKAVYLLAMLDSAKELGVQLPVRKPGEWPPWRP